MRHAEPQCGHRPKYSDCNTCQILERLSASCWALFIIIIGAIIATLCCYLIIRIGDHTGGSDTVKAREIATGLGLAVGALAEMFYDAVPKIQLRVYRAYDYSLSL